MKKKFSTNGAYFIVSKTISLNRCRTGTFCYASILNEKDNPVPILLDSDFESTLNITNNYCSTFYKKKTGFVLTIPIHKRYLNKKNMQIRLYNKNLLNPQTISLDDFLLNELDTIKMELLQNITCEDIKSDYQGITIKHKTHNKR